MIREPVRRVFLSLLTGLFAGLSATIFLYSLHFVTEFRQHHMWIIWFLPIIGLAIGALYYYWGSSVVQGHELILKEINAPREQIKWFMAPYILITTLLTHLFGGSAGREGTAVQMGASLADQLGTWFSLTREDRVILLVGGMGAGFSAAIGAPFAGVIFGIEVVRSRKLARESFVFCIIASLTGYFVTTILAAPHTEYPSLHIPAVRLETILFALFSGLFFGGISHVFIVMSQTIQRYFSYISYPPLRPFVGGCFLVFLYWWEGSYRYAGLGLESIQSALITPSSFLDPLYKTFFTALTVSSGFKGGEFIPLVFMGTTLGSSIGVFLPAYFSLAAGLGFASVFGAASKTPIACSIMAIEIFGFSIAPYIFISCFVASYVNGEQSIYKMKSL